MAPVEAESKVDPDAVRKALRRIRESGILGEGKLVQLLDYLVEEELAGRGDRLKGYSIALDVFNRGEDFDPSTDSVVRVEMLRLRKGLARYRAHAQPPPCVTINLVKGSYRPTFRVAPDAVANGGTSAIRGFLSVRRLAIGGVVTALLALLVIVIFGPLQRDSSRFCSRPSLSLGLDGFVRATSRTQLQGVFGKILQTYPLVQTGTAPSNCPEMQYRLAVAKLADGRAQAALYRSAEKNPFWSERFSADDRELMMARILYLTASPQGVLIKDILRRKWSSRKDRQDYACHMNSYSHYTNWKTDDPADDLACLRESIENKSPFADTYSIYALIAQLHYFDQEPLSKVQRDAELAEYQRSIKRALAIDSADCLALVGRMREYRRAVPPDVDRLGETVKLATQQCGDNPFVLAHLATVHGFVFNDWPQSRQIVDRAIAISGLRHEYTYPIIGNLFIHQDWQGAHDQLEWFHTFLNPIDGIWLVIIGNRVGDQKMMWEGKEFLARRSIKSTGDVEKYLNRLGYHPDIVKKIMAEVVTVFPPHPSASSGK